MLRGDRTGNGREGTRTLPRSRNDTTNKPEQDYLLRLFGSRAFDTGFDLGGEGFVRVAGVRSEAVGPRLGSGSEGFQWESPSRASCTASITLMTDLPTVIFLMIRACMVLVSLSVSAALSQ